MANIYDRIFKENIEPIIPILAERIFGVVIEKSIEIKDKIQITLEGEADFLKKVLHKNPAEDFILHVEFQVKNEPKRVNRMLLYRAFLYNRYELPVKQFVFYIGDKTASMPTGII